MKYCNEHVKNLQPYKPGEQPQNMDSIIKLNTNERKKRSTALVVSDVDSCGERLPLKGLRKVTMLYVFSLLLLLQTAGVKKKTQLV